MKKAMFLGALGLLLIGGSGCKKDWVCNCDYSSSGSSYSAKSVIPHSTKPDAKKACEDLSSSNFGGYVRSCELE